MIYDYRCSDCNEIFEVKHSMSENKDTLGLTCTKCKSSNIKRYLGKLKKIPILFKGTGWAGVDMALDRIGFPKNIRSNPDTKDALKKM